MHIMSLMIYLVSSHAQACSRQIMRMKRVATIKTTPESGCSDLVERIIDYF